MQIRKLDITDLENLRKISIQTFRETFEEVNSEKDMQKYLDENLNLERLKSELENPDSEFYFIENENKRTARSLNIPASTSPVASIMSSDTRTRLQAPIRRNSAVGLPSNPVAFKAGVFAESLKAKGIEASRRRCCGHAPALSLPLPPHSIAIC